MTNSAEQSESIIALVVGELDEMGGFHNKQNAIYLVQSELEAYARSVRVEERAKLRGELLTFMQAKMWEGAIAILDEQFWPEVGRGSKGASQISTEEEMTDQKPAEPLCARSRGPRARQVQTL